MVLQIAIGKYLTLEWMETLKKKETSKKGEKIR